MRKTSTQSLPVKNSSCQTGAIHQTDQCKQLEQLANMLAECSDRLDEISQFKFIGQNDEWTDTLCDLINETTRAEGFVAQMFGYALILSQNKHLAL